MGFDATSRLWPEGDGPFFRERAITPLRQRGFDCVAHCLAMVANQEPGSFTKVIHPQDPRSWSDALTPSGMKLAYVPTDIRRLRFYLPELVELDDLFVLGYYQPDSPAELLSDPDESGWLCSSHLVVLQGSQVYDPALGRAASASEHACGNHHTKRIFRVVPARHARGL